MGKALIIALKAIASVVVLWNSLGRYIFL